MTFGQLAHYFQRLEATRSRLAMTEILAGLFQQANPAEIGKICYLLLGRVAPLYEAIEFGVADKFMMRAIAKAYDVDFKKVARVFKEKGDLGDVAEFLYTGKDQKLSVRELFIRLEQVTQISGIGSQEKKIELLSNLLQEGDSLSARFLARIPLDKLRLGFSDMTILDALSWMMRGDKSLRPHLEEAYNIRPDIGFIAESVKEKGIAGLRHVEVKLGVPILPCLCQRIPRADEMIKKMGTVAVEPKYDGVRVQIHYQKTVRTFSRNLENTTAMFPELQNIGKQVNAHEVILDSEAVGVDPKNGKLISFQETTTRKRKHAIAETLLKVPLKFFVFDILYKDGKSFLSLPFSKRRAILEETVRQNGVVVISDQIVTDSAAQIRTYHNKQLKKGLEGAVVKKWESPYEPGRRGFTWVKFKEEEGKTGGLTDTIDAVVMGYYRGEGKRAGFGIGAFLVGVRKNDSFVTLTKVGTGVSDDLWKELRKKLNDIKTSQKPKEYEQVHKTLVPDVWVHPKIVVEIAGDNFTKSPTHGAGIAVRFPRLVRIREDKSPSDVTTVGEIEDLFAVH